MRYFLFFLFLLCGCQFHPLYNSKVVEGVCVEPIPLVHGYQLFRTLKQYFPSSDHCQYTLQVQTPEFSSSDQSISDKDFITMQKILATASYSLLNAQKTVVLKNSVSSHSSSAVVPNPYATVVAEEKTADNLIPILAEQIFLHITAYLDRNQQ